MGIQIPYIHDQRLVLGTKVPSTRHWSFTQGISMPTYTTAWKYHIPVWMILVSPTPPGRENPISARTIRAEIDFVSFFPELRTFLLPNALIGGIFSVVGPRRLVYPYGNNISVWVSRSEMEISDLRSRAKALLHRSEMSISALPTHTEMFYFSFVTMYLKVLLTPRYEKCT